MLLAGCGSGVERAEDMGSDVVPCESLTPYPRETLPDGIDWLTNDSDPVFASPKAVKGGTLHEALLSFPLTFRVVGPDANSSLSIRVLQKRWPGRQSNRSAVRL